MFVLQVEEFVALTDPRLSLFSGEEEQFDSYNDRPQHKITNFRYYTLSNLNCQRYFNYLMRSKKGVMLITKITTYVLFALGRPSIIC